MNSEIRKESFLLSWTVVSLPVGICFHSACQLILENLCLPVLLVQASQIHALRKPPSPGCFLLVHLPLSAFILYLGLNNIYFCFSLLYFIFALVSMCLRCISDSREEYVKFFFLTKRTLQFDKTWVLKLSKLAN